MSCGEKSKFEKTNNYPRYCIKFRITKLGSIQNLESDCFIKFWFLIQESVIEELTHLHTPLRMNPTELFVKLYELTLVPIDVTSNYVITIFFNGTIQLAI